MEYVRLWKAECTQHFGAEEGRSFDWMDVRTRVYEAERERANRGEAYKAAAEERARGEEDVQGKRQTNIGTGHTAGDASDTHWHWLHDWARRSRSATARSPPCRDGSLPPLVGHAGAGTGPVPAGGA